MISGSSHTLYHYLLSPYEIREVGKLPKPSEIPGNLRLAGDVENDSDCWYSANLREASRHVAR